MKRKRKAKNKPSKRELKLAAKCGNDPRAWNLMLIKLGMGVSLDGLKTGKPAKSRNKYD